MSQLEDSAGPLGTEPPTLETDRLILRPFRAEDAAAVQRLAGDPEIASTTLNIPHPYEDGMAEDWIGTHEPGWADGTMAVFAMTSPEDGLVGAIGLSIKAAHRRAELGYWVGVPFWNRGYATEAVRAVLQFAFETLQLNRVHASYFKRNPASGRVMTKAGMREEGIRRQHFFKDGRFEDVTEYAILRGE